MKEGRAITDAKAAKAEARLAPSIAPRARKHSPQIDALDLTPLAPSAEHDSRMKHNRTQRQGPPAKDRNLGLRRCFADATKRDLLSLLNQRLSGDGVNHGVCHD